MPLEAAYLRRLSAFVCKAELRTACVIDQDGKVKQELGKELCMGNVIIIALARKAGAGGMTVWSQPGCHAEAV